MLLHEDRIEQLSYSADLQYSQPADAQEWKTRMQVAPKTTFHPLDEIKYHFKLCFDLAMHLTIADEKSPLWATLNYLFNFGLLELRLAEIKHVHQLLSRQIIGFDMEQQKMLFVTALALYRLRETLHQQHRRLKSYQQQLFTLGDRPFQHHSAKVLGKQVFNSLAFFRIGFESKLLVFKKAEKEMDDTFWEQAACQFGFVIKTLNSVLIVAPA